MPAGARITLCPQGHPGFAPREEMQQDLECLEHLPPFAVPCLMGYDQARFPVALVPVSSKLSSSCLRKNAKPGVERRP